MHGDPQHEATPLLPSISACLVVLSLGDFRSGLVCACAVSTSEALVGTKLRVENERPRPCSRVTDCILEIHQGLGMKNEGWGCSAILHVMAPHTGTCNPAFSCTQWVFLGA